jgi:hypothetical protein
MKMKTTGSILALATLSLAQIPLLAQTATVANQPSHAAAIPFDHIGAVAGKQYSGDGLALVSSPDGARLRCVFQRLDAKLTTEGLWLVSTKDGGQGKPFRVVARALGRNGATVAQTSKSAVSQASQPGEHLQPLRVRPFRRPAELEVGDTAGLGTYATVQAFALSGRVEMAGQIARFIRPGLTEEYSVGIDGLRQDFVIGRRPVGEGSVRLELEVDGAKAEAMRGGARLVLVDGGRQMVYNRLMAEDARGRELTARLEVVSAHRLALVVDDAAAEYPVRIDPNFSDANWVSLGGMPGVDGIVCAAVVDNAGDLYVGGSFTIAGSVFANDVAEWNGSSWSALGSGISGSVSALAVSGNKLYVGGNFTMAGGVPANNLAQWNGSSWSAVGLGIGDTNGSVNALACDSSANIYAGGHFTTAGGVSAANIARWNGSAWSALGSGVGSGINEGISALAVSGSNLFVGGSFTTAGGVSANNIAEWNGSTWSALDSGAAGIVYALAVSGASLYVGGDFSNAGGLSANGVAEWNGSTWSALDSGVAGIVYALAVSGTNLYVGGGVPVVSGGLPPLLPSFNISQWDGSSWSALGSGIGDDLPWESAFAVGEPVPPGYVRALAISGGKLYVGGGFYTAGGAMAANIAEWNVGFWSALAPGIDGYVNALAILGDNLYVGGGLSGAGGVSANSIVQWNGNLWSALGSGTSAMPFETVDALVVSGTNLFAGGVITTADGPSAGVEQWNGTSWSVLGSGILGGEVYTLAVSGANLYVGGAFRGAGGVPANNIAQWNGSSWSALGSGISGGVVPTVYALAVSGSNLFVGGSFTTAGGVSANNIAEWNGHSWSALGPGIESGGTVLALAVLGNNLFVGGLFETPANNIAQWNGSAWSALGAGLSPQVNALAVSGNNLYAGGYIATVGAVPANNIVQWDGTSWSPLGSGVQDWIVGALAFDSSGNLYVGGDFRTAGTNLAFCLAKALLTGPTPNQLLLANAGGGTNVIIYLGSPGANYALDLATNLAPPFNWMPQTTNTASIGNAATAGYLMFTNSNHLPQGYYRTRLIP